MSTTPTPSSTAYGSGSTKARRGRRPKATAPGARRSKADIDRIREAIRDTLSREHPMTIRGLFYRLVSAGTIAKTEQEYKGTVIRLATTMRLEGEVPFGWVADNTRWRRGGAAFDSAGDWLEASLRTYRLDLWRNQDAYCEIWLEKDALTGVLIEETEPLCVPLLVTRGYPSLTYLADAAAQIQAVGKPSYLYYFGDHDPSGVDIPRSVERRLRQFAPDAEIHFERVAVMPEQIETLGLQTRPTKRTDSRSKGFTGGSVEIDAVPPLTLRRWVKDRIERHIDPAKLEAIRREERLGREALNGIKLPGWGINRDEAWTKSRAWRAWFVHTGGEPDQGRWDVAIRSIGWAESTFTPDDWERVAELAGSGGEGER